MSAIIQDKVFENLAENEYQQCPFGNNDTV